MTPDKIEETIKRQRDQLEAMQKTPAVARELERLEVIEAMYKRVFNR